MKLKCYFAHPFKSKDTEEAKRIIEILESRRVEVLNPFTGEDEMAKKHGVKGYYPTTPYKLGREIWAKDMLQINNCNMTLFWLPEGYTIVGCYAEIQHAVEHQNGLMRKNIHLHPDDQEPHLIQFITEKRHPLIAWALCYNNQLFDNIDNFERYRQTRW